MFDRFTDATRRALTLAREAAQRLRHDFIGTEHILLGLIEVEGLHRAILERYKAAPEAIRADVEKIVKPVVGSVDGDVRAQLPFTPRAKRVLELAVEESSNLGLDEIRTECLLLGLLREGEGVAAQVLVCHGLDRDKVRKDVAMLSGQETAIARASAEHPCGGAGPSACPAAKGAPGAGACPEDKLVARIFDLELVSKDILRAQREQEARLAELVAVLRRLWILAWVTAAGAAALAIAALAR